MSGCRHEICRLGIFQLVLVILLIVIPVQALIDEDGLCSLYTFVPKTSVDNKTIEHTAAALLAMEDFNSRNDSFVKELANFRDCNIQFDMNNSIFFSVDSHSHEAIKDLYRQNKSPCAVAGPFHDLPALELSAMAIAAEFPLVSHRGFNRRLTAPEYNPFTSLLYPDMRGTIKILLEVLQRKGRTNYINFFYPFSDTGFQRRQKLKNAFDRRKTRFNSYSYTVRPEGPDDPRTMVTAMKNMKDDGFRTILVAMDAPFEELPAIADAAEELEMNNGDYFYVWFGEYEREFHWEHVATDPKNANVTKLLSGSLWVLPFERIYGGDLFNDHWISQDSHFVDRLNNKIPLQEGEPGYAVAEPNFFKTAFRPEYGTGFMYDTVMAIGMGACLAQNKSGSAHVEGIQSVDFIGASGRIKFESDSRARESGYVSWIVMNVMPPLPEGGHKFGYEGGQTYEGEAGHKFGEEFTDLYLVASPNSTDDGVWLDVTPFIYANGETTGPILRNETEKNYLHKGYQVFGLVLMCIALVTALATVIWVFVHRKHQVLRAAQPYFLYLVALGSSCYAIAIVFISYDESYGWSQEQLSSACMAGPWLISMGHVITYGALFSKLWRVHRVLQASRQKVEYHHVLWPCAILFFCVLIVLIVWTVVDSLEWVRKEDAITGESIGECKCEHPWAFAAPLVFLLVFTSLLTAYMAYKTRDADDAYSESSYIFILIVVELEMAVIAIPILVILYNVSTSGRYIAFSITLWLFAMAPLLLIMLPKVIAYRKAVSNNNGERRRVRGGGHGQVRVTGLDRRKTGMMKKVSSMFGRKTEETEEMHGSEA